MNYDEVSCTSEDFSILNIDGIVGKVQNKLRKLKNKQMQQQMVKSELIIDQVIDHS